MSISVEVWREIGITFKRVSEESAMVGLGEDGHQ